MAEVTAEVTAPVTAEVTAPVTAVVTVLAMAPDMAGKAMEIAGMVTATECPPLVTHMVKDMVTDLVTDMVTDTVTDTVTDMVTDTVTDTVTDSDMADMEVVMVLAMVLVMVPEWDSSEVALEVGDTDMVSINSLVYTVKLVLNGHSQKRPKIGFQDQLSLNAGPEVIKLFSYSTQLSTKRILSTIVGILTFNSMINTTSERLKAASFFICRYFSLFF